MSITMFKEILLLLEIYLGGDFICSIIMFISSLALPISFWHIVFAVFPNFVLLNWVFSN